MPKLGQGRFRCRAEQATGRSAPTAGWVARAIADMSLGSRLFLLAIILFAFLLFAPQADAQTDFRIEETEITLVGIWEPETFGVYSDGRAVFANFSTHDPNAHATFEFEGTGITWIGARTHNAGLFDWVVDEGTADERRRTGTAEPVPWPSADSHPSTAYWLPSPPCCAAPE